jgi:RNA:NAD 2'-phosphotransferase (TPT1/KptA family)
MLLYHGTSLKLVKKILRKGLLPSSKTKYLSGYPTNINRVFLSNDLDEAKFYTKLHKKWAILSINLSDSDFKKLDGKYIGSSQYTFKKIPRNKIHIYSHS